MRAGAGRARGDAVGQGLLHRPVHLAAQFPRAVGAGGFGREGPADLGGVGQGVAAAGGTLLQLAQKPVGNGRKALGAQRAEHDHVVQTAQQLGAEKALGLGDGLLGLLFKHGLLPGGKAQRRGLPGQKARPEVGRQQDDGVGEIRLAAGGVGETAVLQKLQKDVLDVGVGLFDLVEQHHAVGPAADRLGQLAPLVVAQIARRRAQQPGHRVGLLVFGHIKFEQRLVAAKPAAGQRL